METACVNKCEAISKCDCGELLCEHMFVDHAKKGHNTYSITPQMKVEHLLSIISQRKEEVIKTTESIMLQVQKIASYQLSQLEKLRQRVIDMEDIDRAKKNLDALGPSKEHLKELKSFVETLDCEKLTRGVVVSASEDNTIRVWKDGKLGF